MTTIGHMMGGDIQLNANSAALVSDTQETLQGILRRLLTNAGAYVWHTEYGAGLPQKVGAVVDATSIEAIIQEQMALEDTVDQTQPIVVSVTSDSLGKVVCAIQYTDASTGAAQTITL